MCVSALMNMWFLYAIFISVAVMLDKNVLESGVNRAAESTNELHYPAYRRESLGPTPPSPKNCVQHHKTVLQAWFKILGGTTNFQRFSTLPGVHVVSRTPQLVSFENGQKFFRGLRIITQRTFKRIIQLFPSQSLSRINLDPLGLNEREKNVKETNAVFTVFLAVCAI